MSDQELHPYVEWIAREARKSVAIDPTARARVMAAVRREPVPSRRFGFLARLIQPRPFTLSPVGATLLAAGLVGLGIVGGSLVHNRDGQLPVGQPTVAVAPRLPVSPVSKVVDTVVWF